MGKDTLRLLINITKLIAKRIIPIYIPTKSIQKCPSLWTSANAKFYNFFNL